MLRCNMKSLAIALLCIGMVFTAQAQRSVEEVSNANELLKAVRNANKAGGHADILLADGEYAIRQRIIITAPHITIRSKSGIRENVVLTGKGMEKRSDIEVIFDVKSKHVTLAGFTAQNVSNHIIQVRGGKDADNFTLQNCILRDSYEQFIKVGQMRDKGDEGTADNALIENCIIEYTASQAPNWYTGGIDVHGSHGWVVRNNTFRNIASPGEKIAEHAIHFWDGTKDIKVINNVVINSDRGIGFGLGNREAEKSNIGGLIEGNIIISNDKSHLFNDVGIGLESSPDSVVRNNTIFYTVDYPNAIEYRFSATKDVVIENNNTNREIKSRNGGEAYTYTNRCLKQPAPGIFGA